MTALVATAPQASWGYVLTVAAVLVLALATGAYVSTWRWKP